MPGSFDSDSSSPSLLSSSSLRQFRFQNRSRTPSAKPYTKTILSTPKAQSRTLDSSPEKSECITIPETPESERRKEAAKPKESPQSTLSGQDSLSSSSVLSFQKRISCFRRVIPVINDSESASTSQNSLEQVSDDTKMDGDQGTDLLGKESRLRELLTHCPGTDLMEAQDTLVQCNWNIDEAIECCRKKSASAKKLTLSTTSNSHSSSKGVKYYDFAITNSLASSSNSNMKLDEIVIDSDEEPKANKKKNINPKFRCLDNGLYFAEDAEFVIVPPAPSNKKRKRIICPDDDSDECTLSSTKTNAISSNSKVSSTKESETAFSVLDFKPKPKPSGPFIVYPNNVKKVIPTNRFFSENRPSTSHLTYSKNRTVQPTLVHRVIDKSLFSDGAKVEPAKTHLKKSRKDVSDDEDAEEYGGNNDVYDSEESDNESGQSLNPARSAVLKFMQTATVEELVTIPGCSKKKVEALVKYRPFSGWTDLVCKLNKTKSLSADLLNGAKKVLDMRLAVSRLMTKCHKIATEMEDLVEDLKNNREGSKDHISVQPSSLNKNMHLTAYQMLGINWLNLMHTQEVNGILADEMGLGKTVQAIAFLAHLKQTGVEDPHLIVVPSSTLDNWQNEFHSWWPAAHVLCYHGSQEFRRELRMDIINDEAPEFDVMVTTYNMVASSSEDRSFFKKLQFHYVIFDEAHMLKNMASQRYQNLMKVKAKRRLLLTGTPLQNNLVELMSLLIFAMPHMFSGKTDHIKQMFSSVCKSDEGKSKFERERIEHAKKIMKPFVLRRLKNEVLKDLPKKHEEIKYCEMTQKQKEEYFELVVRLSDEVKRSKEGEINSRGAGMMMQLRKAANHPLLLRTLYDDSTLGQMAKLMLKEPTHQENNVDYILEDMQLMSDFELHKLCQKYKSLKSYILDDSHVLNSGKFEALDDLIGNYILQDRRILLFSQFTMVLDIIEEYMKLRNHDFLRLDGQIPVSERQQLIDEFNENQNIPVFLLSTRAGGLGINLTAASVVLIHDIDFNPYNDKQAEDRCHRVGQIRDVTVVRMISKDTIEEGMLQSAKEKLKLEEDVTTNNNDEEANSASVAKLLRDALGISTSKS